MSGDFLLYLLKWFCDRKGVGAIFSDNSGSSKNDPKSIAICPGVKIDHFGIIRNPHNPQQYLNKPSQTKQSPKCFAVFWALLDPISGQYPLGNY